MLKRLGILLPIFFTLSLVQAQPSSPTPIPSQANKGPLTPEEIFSLATDMTRLAYDKAKTQKNLSELVANYERLIDVQCASAFKFSTTTVKNSDKCNKTIEEVLALNVDNPVAICARDGVRSKSCLLAFESQDVGTLDSNTYSFTDDLSNPEAIRKDSEAFGLEIQMNQAKILSGYSSLDADATRLESELIADNSPENREKLRDIYTSLLHLSCKLTRLRLVPSAQREGLKSYIFYGKSALKAGPTPAPGSVEELIANFDKKTPAPTPDPKNDSLSRLRLVSPYCQNTLLRATGRFTDFATAICYRDGWNSPSCVTALVNEKSLPHPSSTADGDKASTAPSNKLANPESESGLGTF